MGFAEEAHAEIKAARGLSREEKKLLYTRFTCKWREDVPIEPYRAYSRAMWQAATEVYNWEEKPPVWYHGGAAGLSAGDEILPFPYVPSGRKTLFENLSGGIAASLNPRPKRPVFFSQVLMAARQYAIRCKNGKIYIVEPEGEILADPEWFISHVLVTNDPEINPNQGGEVVLNRQTIPRAWCSPSARVVRLW
ncbi:hypothetical protein [Roseovarius mucosus]|uniref:hypothetical protein n=1 Tax=Roseovarius mucosus TaxID=215743 RepID=UPI003F723B53